LAATFCELFCQRAQLLFPPFVIKIGAGIGLGDVGTTEGTGVPAIPVPLEKRKIVEVNYAPGNSVSRLRDRVGCLGGFGPNG
jgi:hypothetical protein